MRAHGGEGVKRSCEHFLSMIFEFMIYDIAEISNFLFK